MKPLLLTCLLLSAFAALLCCEPKMQFDPQMQSEHASTMTYDSALAISLGADDYGMKHYVMALLKAGPHRDQDSATTAQIQQAHMANINKLAEEGTLVVAGPFEDGGELRGIFIFNVPNLEDARKLTAQDPAVKAGRLIMELHPWYGSAAMMQVNALHQTLSKKSF